MKIPLLIIGGGLSGLAAAIRYARYSPEVLLVEKHSRLGGLNSYYYRNKVLLETGLHAITNFAEPDDRKAPLNKLFRQLKLSRKKFNLLPQNHSEIRFPTKSLIFSNDFTLLTETIGEEFPESLERFQQLIISLDSINPFETTGFVSAKEYLQKHLKSNELVDMLLCPLCFYGSSVENDMDLNQFVIMFRSIYQEGMFRPEGTIKSFLDALKEHYDSLGGRLMLNANVVSIGHEGNNVTHAKLADGTTIECEHLLSTIGHEETLKLVNRDLTDCSSSRRLGFVESIFLVEQDHQFESDEKTIIFFNNNDSFSYQKPDTLVDFTSGVVCFPFHFQGRKVGDYTEVRSTHLANYDLWRELRDDKCKYADAKQHVITETTHVLTSMIGEFRAKSFFHDTFTPLTIERYTAKKDGAIYGSPYKIKDGDIGFNNLFLAGTDQGFLGIVGSMLSGISMVNKHLIRNI